MNGPELARDILIVLGGALFLGVVCERIGLGAVLGYLAAGALLGPGAFGAITQTGEIWNMAGLGVALLLFTIGLEFSWRRLVRFGRATWFGGTLSILLLFALGLAATKFAGFDWSVAVALGAALAMASTSIVVPILKTRNELDSLHGRVVIGILLLQDLALVPLVLLVTFLNGGGKGNLVDQLGRAGLMLVILVAVLVLASKLTSKLLDEKIVARNRELPILVAFTMCMGAGWVAQTFGFSPALGTFLAGLLLANSRFADQIRADVLPLKTLFITLFYASVGLLADMSWSAQHIGLVLGVATFVVITKIVFTYVSIRPFSVGIVGSLASAIVLSHVGEFSFVVTTTAFAGRTGLGDLQKLAVSVTFVTLLVTPFLVSHAPHISRWIAKRVFRARTLAQAERKAQQSENLNGHVVVIGYGEAGQAACKQLMETRFNALVVEINPRLVALAENHGFRAVLGDATHSAILERARVPYASRVIVAVPDHVAGRIIISQSKILASHVPVIARSRYHAYAEELDMIGADVVVDEENTVGLMLGAAAIPKTEDPGEHPELDPYHSLR